MRVSAVSWALRQPVGHSPAKFVLVVLAHHANINSQPWSAFASVTTIANETGQNRKTVLENLKRLVDLGYLSDSGKREGGTGRIVVWTLSDPSNGPNSGTIKSSQDRDHSISPNQGPLNSPNSGTIKAISHANSPSLGTIEDGNGPKFGTEGKPEIVPNSPTELYIKEVIPLSVGTDKDKSTDMVRKSTRGTRLPTDWVLPKAWGEWAMENRPDLDRQGVLGLADQFRDHWIALAGAKATKIDWAATWRNWVRNDLNFNRGTRRASQTSEQDVIGTVL